MEQVSAGYRFLPVYPRQTAADPQGVFAAGHKNLILFIVFPSMRGERAGEKTLDCTVSTPTPTEIMQEKQSPLLMPVYFVGIYL